MPPTSADSPIRALIEQLTHEAEASRNSAVEALADIGQAAVPSLVEALHSEHVVTRGNAAAALGRMEAEATAAVPALIEVLKDQDTQNRFLAARALGEIVQGCEPAAPELMRLLADPDGAIRCAAIWALASIQQGAHSAAGALLGLQMVPFLVALLLDSAGPVRCAAAYALGGMRAGKVAASQFIAMLRDSEPAVRSAAAWALGRIAVFETATQGIDGYRGSPPTMPDGRSAYGSRPRPSSSASTPAASPSLLELLDDPSADVRCSAIRTLGELNEVTAIPKLIAAVLDKDIMVRECAVAALQLFGPEAVQALAEALQKSMGSHQEREAGDDEQSAPLDEAPNSTADTSLYNSSLLHGRRTVEKQTAAMFGLLELLLELRPGDAASHRALCKELHERKRITRAENAVLADLHALERHCGPLFERRAGFPNTLLPRAPKALQRAKRHYEKQIRIWFPKWRDEEVLGR
jgi:HEAT repeat protein